MRYVAGFLFLFVLVSCTGQTVPPASPKPATAVGGPCDGCELLFTGMPDQLSATDTSAGWQLDGQQLQISGTIWQADARTPAADVILYYWQTDPAGLYTPDDQMPTAARRHGRIRGWVKTGPDGRYTINTTRPGSYPGRDIPAHIHLVVKEPDISTPYYIDDLVFDDDPLLTTAERDRQPGRGGSGVLRPVWRGKLQLAQRDIYLGLRIPGHPLAVALPASGLPVGSDSPSFTPRHAYGPDQGSKACPVCKYGRYLGILYFVTADFQSEDVGRWLTFLERESQQRGERLKVYFVYVGDDKQAPAELDIALAALGRQLDLKTLALTYVPSATDRATEMYRNQIDPTVPATLIVYRQRRIIANWNDPAPTAARFRQLQDLLDSAASPTFSLPEVGH